MINYVFNGNKYNVEYALKQVKLVVNWVLHVNKYKSNSNKKGFNPNKFCLSQSVTPE